MPLPSSSRNWKLSTIDVSGVSARALNDLGHLQTVLRAALRMLGVSPRGWINHRFEPHGVSLLGHGPRARVALHTWPELGAATIDLWTEGVDGTLALELCAAVLSSGSRKRPSTSMAAAVTPGE